MRTKSTGVNRAPIPRKYQIEIAGVVKETTKKEGLAFLKANPDFGYEWDHTSVLSTCTIRKVKS